MNDTFNGADVHDVGYFLRHDHLVRLLVGICQFVLDDVQSWFCRISSSYRWT